MNHFGSDRKAERESHECCVMPIWDVAILAESERVCLESRCLGALCMTPELGLSHKVPLVKSVPVTLHMKRVLLDVWNLPVKNPVGLDVPDSRQAVEPL